MITVHREAGVLELYIRGTLEHDDVDQLRHAVRTHVAQHDAAPLLLCFENYQGHASPPVVVNDLRLALEQWRHIPRIALIDEPPWLDKLRRGHEKLRPRTDIRHFEREDHARARRWLAQGPAPVVRITPTL